ncbi:TPA: hypothetical protein UDO34_001503 [Streptococcus suis]|nr:hypothetical protein [Streptococcus suis]
MVDSEKDDLGDAVGPGARVHVCHPALDLQSFLSLGLFLSRFFFGFGIYPRASVFCNQIHFPQLEEKIIAQLV